MLRKHLQGKGSYREQEVAGKDLQGKGKIHSCYYLMDNDIFLSNKEMDIFKLGMVVFRIAII